MKQLLVFFALVLFTALCYAQKNDYNYLAEQGLEQLKQQNPDKAIEYYKQALKLDSTRVEANYGIGVAYLFKGNQYLKALHYLNKAISINDEYRNGYYNRARCKGFLQDYTGAINDFNKAAEKNPTDADIYLGRALIKIKLNENNSACADLLKSAELGSQIAKQMVELNCQIKN